MKTPRHVLTSVVIASAASTAAAVPLACYQDPTTDAVQCVEEKRISEVNGIRIAPLWTGGPANIKKTSFTVHVNCGTNVLHVKDRQGVSFTGGSASSTPATRQLRDIMCKAQLTPRKK